MGKLKAFEAGQDLPAYQSTLCIQQQQREMVRSTPSKKYDTMTNAELLEASPKKPSSSPAKEARLRREAEFDAALLKINSPVVTSNTSTRRSSAARRNSKFAQEPPLADAMEAYFCARLRQLSTRKSAAVDTKLEERLSNQSP